MDVIRSFGLKGKAAVVTGGAGLYGRQVAEALAEAGATTFMAARDQAKLEAQAATFRDRGLSVTALPLDQSRQASVDALLATVVDRAGGVDVLVNNAVLRPMATMDAPASEFARSMDVNATGIFMMCRAFGRHMVERGRGGSIVNVSSIQGMIGPDLSLYEGVNAGPPPDYFFHKGGMIQLTRYMASHFGRAGVRVNAISPGGFYDGQDDRFVRRYNDRTFLGRMADDTDLKGVIVFLASDASRYITGVNLPVDGGYTAK